jgi:hypothetical protein
MLMASAEPHFHSAGRSPRPCPDDFEQVLVEIGRLACEEHYGVGRVTVNRWLEECGKDRLLKARAAQDLVNRTLLRRRCPPDFEITFIMLGFNECRRRYHANFRLVSRWIDECGRERLTKAREGQTRRSELKLNRAEIGAVLDRAFPVNLTDEPDERIG